MSRAIALTLGNKVYLDSSVLHTHVVIFNSTFFSLELGPSLDNEFKVIILLGYLGGSVR